VKDLTKLGVDLAVKLGARYADVRVVDRFHEEITTKNGKVEALSTNADAGFGVRVLVNGSWGFASSALLERTEVKKVAELAVRIAQASARVPGEPVTLNPVDRSLILGQASFRLIHSPCRLEEKIEVLLDADRVMRQEAAIRVAEGEIHSYRQHKWFASSEVAI